MRACVTGATGFVGSAVVHALLAEGYAVRCLVRPGSDRRNLEGLDVELAPGDVCAPETLAPALRGCDELYHVAALYSTRPEDAARLFEVNVEGTRHVLRAGLKAGLQCVVYTSTIGTIGRRRDGRPPTEEDLFADAATASPYARSKLAAEALALELAASGAPIVVVNPCAPVGPRDIKPSSTGQRILDYLRGRVPSFPAGGMNFLAVEDVAAGHLLAARHGRPGQRYILGHQQGNLTLAGFYALMRQASGLEPPGLRQRSALRRLAGQLRRALGGAAAGQPSGYQPSALTADPARAVRELGLPQTPLAVAFGRAVTWFRENGYI
ncbi:MAG: NAD-dependent epimerase/dehydratase family protein [Chloroflexota bacterium]